MEDFTQSNDLRTSEKDTTDIGSKNESQELEAQALCNSNIDDNACSLQTNQESEAVPEPKHELESNSNGESVKEPSYSGPERLDAASKVVEQALTIDETDLVTTEEVNEAYDNIMSVCSTAAQAIKKTIAEVLSSRDEYTSVETKGPSSDLETSLKEKIADFKNAVSSCCPIDEAECVASETETSKREGAVSAETEDKPTVLKPCDPATDVKPVETDNATPNKQLSIDSKEKTTAKIEPVTPQETAKIPINLEDEKYLKKQQKNYSNKRKGEKTVDQILKSLSNCSTTDEKLQMLCKKHIETLEELRLVEPRLKQSERQVITLNREKEQLQAEHNRMILAKSRLESLCRELQRQNKAVKEESLLRIREEEEKRKEVANKFQVTLNDISLLMQENSKKNIQLREENAELAKKLKALVDHYEMWEKHMEKVVQQKDLETQLAKAKQAKTNLLLKQETEKFLREKQSLLENMSELQKKCTMLASNELQLRTELGDYTTKYEEFQSVLNKSSQVFATFKTDMETTSKKIKKLEKETNVYKQKWESSNNALLDMISDKQKRDKEMINSKQRVLTLEKLCRALQAERNDLQNQLNVLSSAQVEACNKDVPLPPSEAVVSE